MLRTIIGELRQEFPQIGRITPGSKHEAKFVAVILNEGEPEVYALDNEHEALRELERYLHESMTCCWAHIQLVGVYRRCPHSPHHFASQCPQPDYPDPFDCSHQPIQIEW